ncbi:hypothetical protein EDB85DRAFT_213131 [Lactarius pseudohatsudake]|nr:hypothetical protein EDB85DRAFT_213131 [Lactarius pseudohatsudake]
MASPMLSHPKFPASYIASGSPAWVPRQATTLVLHTSHRLSSYLRRPSYRDSAVSPNLPRTSVASIRLSRPFRRAQVCDDPLWAAPHGPVIQRTSCSAPSVASVISLLNDYLLSKCSSLLDLLISTSY